MEIELRRRGLVDPAQEADELDGTVLEHALADDLAAQNVEGGEQRRGAVALVVVMGHGPGATFLHRQAGLGAVERLDLLGWMAPSR